MPKQTSTSGTHSTVRVVIEGESVLRTLVVSAFRCQRVGADDVLVLRLGQQPGRVKPHGVAAGARPTRDNSLLDICLKIARN